MKRGTQDPRASLRAWRACVLAQQALRNFHARSLLQTAWRVLLGSGSREGRQPSAGRFRLSLWDVKEGFPGCSGAWAQRSIGSGASRQLSPLVTGRELRGETGGAGVRRSPTPVSPRQAREPPIAPCSLSRLFLVTGASLCDGVCAPTRVYEGAWLGVTGVGEQDQEASASRLTLTSSPEL